MTHESAAGYDSALFLASLNPLPQKLLTIQLFRLVFVFVVSLRARLSFLPCLRTEEEKEVPTHIAKSLMQSLLAQRSGFATSRYQHNVSV